MDKFFDLYTESALEIANAETLDEYIDAIKWCRKFFDLLYKYDYKNGKKCHMDHLYYNNSINKIITAKRIEFIKDKESLKKLKDNNC